MSLLGAVIYSSAEVGASISLMDEKVSGGIRRAHSQLLAQGLSGARPSLLWASVSQGSSVHLTYSSGISHPRVNESQISAEGHSWAQCL